MLSENAPVGYSKIYVGLLQSVRLLISCKAKQGHQNYPQIPTKFKFWSKKSQMQAVGEMRWHIQLYFSTVFLEGFCQKMQVQAVGEIAY